MQHSGWIAFSPAAISRLESGLLWLEARVLLSMLSLKLAVLSKGHFQEAALRLLALC